MNGELCIRNELYSVMFVASHAKPLAVYARQSASRYPLPQAMGIHSPILLPNFPAHTVRLRDPPVMEASLEHFQISISAN